MWRGNRSWFLGIIMGGSLLVIFVNIPHDSLTYLDWHITDVEPEGRERNYSACDMPKLSNMEEFYEYGKTRVKNSSCLNLVSFGRKHGDGHKMVCLDKEYDIKSGTCVVLSFGIGGDWSFDDKMAKFGCKIYSFDPTIGKPNHKHSNNVHFFNLGLSDIKGQIKIGKKNCSVDRYEGILQKLNLTNRKIDYLKIDIEGSELNFFRDVFNTTPNLLKNVKQIGMEIHPGFPLIYSQPNERIKLFWKYMTGLECFGYTMLSYELNMYGGNPYKYKGRQESACYEVVWGNKFWK